MDEILNVVNDIYNKLKELYYLCEKNNVKVSVDLDTIHYALHSRIIPIIDNLKNKLGKNNE